MNFFKLRFFSLFLFINLLFSPSGVFANSTIEFYNPTNEPTYSIQNEPVILKAKYWSILGRKVFSKFYSPMNRVLLVNFSLTWTNYDDSLHRGGFDIKSAKSKKLLEPFTPGDCSIKLMGGAFSPQSISYNGISMELTGSDCMDISDEIHSVPMKIELQNVPALFTRTIYSKVIIEIEETP